MYCQGTLNARVYPPLGRLLIESLYYLFGALFSGREPLTLYLLFFSEFISTLYTSKILCVIYLEFYPSIYTNRLYRFTTLYRTGTLWPHTGNWTRAFLPKCFPASQLRQNDERRRMRTNTSSEVWLLNAKKIHDKKKTKKFIYAVWLSDVIQNPIWSAQDGGLLIFVHSYDSNFEMVYTCKSLFLKMFLCQFPRLWHL